MKYKSIMLVSILFILLINTIAYATPLTYNVGDTREHRSAQTLYTIAGGYTFNVTDNSSIDTIKCYLKRLGTGFTTWETQCAIYYRNNYTLIRATDTKLVLSTNFMWYTYTFSPKINLTINTEYMILIRSDGSSGSASVGIGIHNIPANNTVILYSGWKYSNGWISPVGYSNYTYSNIALSMYGIIQPYPYLYYGNQTPINETYLDFTATGINTTIQYKTNDNNLDLYYYYSKHSPNGYWLNVDSSLLHYASKNITGCQNALNGLNNWNWTSGLSQYFIIDLTDVYTVQES